MNRIEIYNKMKELGIKHYILSATQHTPSNKVFAFKTEGFHKCHHTDESFDAEIEYLTKQGYDFFDVIHLHQ